MFCWPWPRFFPQLAVFYAECFGRPVSQKGAGKRCDSCVGHGYSDLHTSSWWIIRAVMILWTCCWGLCMFRLSTDDLVAYWTQTVTSVLIPQFPPEICWLWSVNLQISWCWVLISWINESVSVWKIQTNVILYQCHIQNRPTELKPLWLLCNVLINESRITSATDSVLTNKFNQPGFSWRINKTVCRRFFCNIFWPYVILTV